MPTEDIRLSEIIPAKPERLFEAWLSSKEHTAMTGGEAKIEPTTFGRHSAWDGYIEGITLELDRPRRIVQTWRTTEFPRSSPDSRLEVLMEAAAGGTRLTIVHTDIPEGDGGKYEGGWKENYLEPMLAYFGGGAARKPKAAKQKKSKAKPKKKAKAATKRVAPKKKKAKSETRRKAAPLGKRKVRRAAKKK
jgi:activator of HSP90 ATPase